MGAICCATVIFSIIACYKYLHDHEDAFSPKTANLFRSLLNMLVIDLCVAGSTGKYFLIELKDGESVV